MAIKHFCDRCGDEITIPINAQWNPQGDFGFIVQSGVFRVEVSCKKVAEIKDEEKPSKHVGSWTKGELCTRCVATIVHRGEFPPMQVADGSPSS